jgi:hypothetical protein
VPKEDVPEEELPNDTPPAPESPVQEKPKRETEAGVPQTIRCRACRADITFLEARISLSGSHEHFFRNPAGIRFRVGCFAYAPGAETFGIPTEEHTWFEGYAWCLALCSSCTTHIGWNYRSDEGGSFFGLIVDQLIYPDEA